MINYCTSCASTRGIEPKAIQSKQTCDLCGTKAHCSQMPFSQLPPLEYVFSEKGYLQSKDLSGMLALIKSRQAVITPRIKELETEISIPYQKIEFAEKAYIVEVLADEGFTKRSINTAHQIFQKIKDVLQEIVENPDTRTQKKLLIQNLMAEKSGLDEKEKELSILFKNSIDQILLHELKHIVGKERFEKAVIQAKHIYSVKNKKGVRK